MGAEPNNPSVDVWLFHECCGGSIVAVGSNFRGDGWLLRLAVKLRSFSVATLDRLSNFENIVLKSPPRSSLKLSSTRGGVAVLTEEVVGARERPPGVAGSFEYDSGMDGTGSSAGIDGKEFFLFPKENVRACLRKPLGLGTGGISSSATCFRLFPFHSSFCGG